MSNEQKNENKNMEEKDEDLGQAASEEEAGVADAEDRPDVPEATTARTPDEDAEMHPDEEVPGENDDADDVHDSPMLSRRWIVIAGLALAFLVLLGYGIAAYLMPQKPVAATVNGEPIYTNLLNARIDMMGGSQVEAGSDQALALREQALDQLINQELLLQDATLNGFVASEEEIDRELESFAASYDTEEELRNDLAERNFTLDDLRISIANQILLEQYIDNTAMTEVEVSDEEVQEFYDAYAEQSEDPLPFEEIEGAVIDEIRQRKVAQVLSNRLTILREEADIVIH